MRSLKQNLFATLLLLPLLALNAAGAESVGEAERRKMADAVESTRILYERLEREIDGTGHSFDRNTVSFQRRMDEFSDFTHAVESLERLPRPALGSLDATERISLSHGRAEFEDGQGEWEAPAARSFMVGPDQSIHPYSGEVALERTDIVKPGRAELDFRFIRYYRSLLDYNGSMGFGWDHNHNIRLLRDEADASRLTLLNGVDCIGFHKDGGNWLPEPGRFLTLTIDDAVGEVVITSPTGFPMSHWIPTTDPIPDRR